MAVLPNSNIRGDRTDSNLPKIRFPERKISLYEVNGVQLPDADLLHEPA